jgi:hypothetical protein
MRRPLAGLPETNGDLRHVDVTEFVQSCDHIRANAADMIRKIEAGRKRCATVLR